MTNQLPIIDDFRPGIGVTVFFYSTVLERIVEGTVEGYASFDWKEYKILEVTLEGIQRHVVHWSRLAPTRQGAEAIAEELIAESRNIEKLQEFNISNGQVVWLKPSPDEDVHKNQHGIPIPYQVVAIYGRTSKAKVVTEYGEEIGTFPFENIVLTDLTPLFHREQYKEGEMVTWIEGDDVYMGCVEVVHDWTVEVVNISKLMPTDFRKRLPFYKVPDGRDQIPPPPIIKTIIEKMSVESPVKPD